MLDTFIERWTGPLLVVFGIGALLVGLYGLMTTEVAEVDPTRGVFLPVRDPREKYEMLSLAGLPLLIWGVSLIRYFRRERSTRTDLPNTR